MDLNKKNILITGGAGFIGGALIEKLISNYDVNIFNLDKLGYASDLERIKKAISNLDKFKEERYNFLKVNLSNIDEVNKAVKKADPDLVMHLAAESHVDRSIKNPSNFIQSNIVGTFNLLDAVKSHWDSLNNTRKNDFRFHHISTDEVFGSLGTIGSFTEFSRYDPRSPYSASKASSDHLVKAWYHTFGLPTLITNCSNNYGPWQFPEKLIPVIINNIFNGKKIPIYGDGQNIRDWLHVKDHINALLLVVSKGKVGETYCIGGYGETSNIELTLRICSILDKIKPANTPYSGLIQMVDDRLGHDKRYSIDSSKIKDELKWSPKITLEEGLYETINWYMVNQEWCRKKLYP